MTSVKIEDYLESLPQNIITGDDITLPDNSLREIFDFIKLGKDDVFYHLGCGDSRGIEIAVKEYNVKKAKGIDIDELKITKARSKAISKTELICADICDQQYTDATVILFWFTEQKIIDDVIEKFQALRPGCKIITILDPLLDFKPDDVRFPYIIHNTPLRKACSMQEQLQSIYDVKCIDFTTAWEYAERYTRAISDAASGNDRFVTIMQALMIWINAKNLGLSCDKEMPESIKTYMSILREFFGIEVKHLLKK